MHAYYVHVRVHAINTHTHTHKHTHTLTLALAHTLTPNRCGERKVHHRPSNVHVFPFQVQAMQTAYHKLHSDFGARGLDRRWY